jgi:hypothetical protein
VRETTSSFVNQIVICKGDPYPETCPQRTLGAEGFLCFGLHARVATGFLCLYFLCTCPFGVRDSKRDKSNQPIDQMTGNKYADLVRKGKLKSCVEQFTGVMGRDRL